MMFEELIQLCKEYDSLGSSAQETLDAIIAGADLAEVDGDLRYIANFLDFASQFDAGTDVYDLWDKITDYLNAK